MEESPEGGTVLLERVRGGAQIVRVPATPDAMNPDDTSDDASRPGSHPASPSAEAARGEGDRAASPPDASTADAAPPDASPADASPADAARADVSPVAGPPGDVASRSAGEGTLSSGDLERVIRRAAELQHSGGGESPDALSEEEVVRIGREVGLESRHVRRALAEHRAESLVPTLPGDEAPLKVLGEGRVRASRAVPGTRAEVQEKVEDHFRSRESLRAVRRRPGRSLWEPAGSLLSKMQRTLDVGGRGYELAEARSVELSVASLEAGWSLATLTVDARNLRSRHAVNWMAGSAPFYLAAALALELAAGVPWLVTGPLAGGGLLATAAAGGGWSYGKKRTRLELVLSGLLDRLEQGGALEPESPGWRERFLGEA